MIGKISINDEVIVLDDEVEVDYNITDDANNVIDVKTATVKLKLTNYDFTRMAGIMREFDDFVLKIENGNLDAEIIENDVKVLSNKINKIMNLNFINNEYDIIVAFYKISKLILKSMPTEFQSQINENNVN